MSHSPEQMRKKEEAREESERHHKYSAVDGMKKEAEKKEMPMERE